MSYDVVTLLGSLRDDIWVPVVGYSVWLNELNRMVYISVKVIDRREPSATSPDAYTVQTIQLLEVSEEYIEEYGDSVVTQLTDILSSYGTIPGWGDPITWLTGHGYLSRRSTKAPKRRIKIRPNARNK